MFYHDKLAAIVDILSDGGLILLPTDTTWGVSCDATNPEAVEKLRKLLQRPASEGVVCIVADLAMLHAYVNHVHPRIENVLAYHTRPLTVVYEGGVGLANNVAADNGSVAVRITKDAFCKYLIEQFGKPLVCAVACIHGQNTPSHFGAVSSEILQNVAHVVRYRQEEKDMNPPSVMAFFNEMTDELEFIRD